MESTELAQPKPVSKMTEAEFDRSFKPTGAIAFFIVLIILGAIIWYGIYFLMLQRA
ncbi:MAG TPA: cytochrome c oxidase subunit 2A [Flavisolibacter sp.]|nr:cytochrome c oxidase subunit 2A [Flavisolibacter sp.]